MIGTEKQMQGGRHKKHQEGKEKIGNGPGKHRKKTNY
jgi:hypothetical protein